MLENKKQTTIFLTPKLRRALADIAIQEGKELGALIEHILQKEIEKKSPGVVVLKEERIRKNYDRIRQHRKAFLAKRDNTPLKVDTVALLEQIRGEHDKHLLSINTSHYH